MGEAITTLIFARIWLWELLLLFPTTASWDSSSLTPSSCQLSLVCHVLVCARQATCKGNVGLINDNRLLWHIIVANTKTSKDIYRL